MTKEITLDDLRGMSSVTITPAQAAAVLHCDPAYIRLAAAEKPELLGFPVMRTGKRTRIPRIPFLRFLGAEDGNGR